MARPNKQGLDYFPLDVDFLEDEKMLAISGEFSVKGEVIVLRLLCEIYRNGYFVEYSGLLKNKLARLGGLSGGLVEEVVKKLVEYNFFDKEVFCEYNVLTSKGIQKRYLEATKRRKKIDYSQFWLLNGVNVDINSSLKGVNVDINAQSKVKESKEYIYNTNTREIDFKNKDLNISSNQDAQNEKEITAWRAFDQNSLELSDWFVSRWKAGKKYYKAGAVGKIVINGTNRINLQEIAKEFTQEQINIALNGLFMQKTIYKEFTLTPFKFLQMEHFQRFYQAGLNRTQVFEDKKKSKTGALRSVGDL